MIWCSEVDWEDMKEEEVVLDRMSEMEHARWIGKS